MNLASTALRTRTFLRIAVGTQPTPGALASCRNCARGKRDRCQETRRNRTASPSTRIVARALHSRASDDNSEFMLAENRR